MAVIVVPTTLTGPSSGPGQAAISAGQADLQGWAIEQAKINMKSGRDCLLPQQGGPCLKLYVMVANIGTDNQNDVYADQIAQQIINLKQDEKYTLLGGIGWPRSTNNTIAAIRRLGDAHILTVSPTASTDALSGISPYFFRVIPPDTQQGTYAAQYVENELHLQHVALFVDQDNPYSSTLANSFYNEFAKILRIRSS